MPHPRQYPDDDPIIERLRQLCLALGQVAEKEAWGECTFRAIGGSMFAMIDHRVCLRTRAGARLRASGLELCDHHQSGHQAVWIKAPMMVQEILINSNGARFFKPPYLGPKGWVGVRLGSSTDWDELRSLVTDGYRLSVKSKPAPLRNHRPARRTTKGGTMKEPTDYKSRLKALKDEQARLERKQAELLERRRTELGRLLERLELLEADDEALAGALLELKEALAKRDDERLARWRAAGASFRRRDKDPKAAAPRPRPGLAQSGADAPRH